MLRLLTCECHCFTVDRDSGNGKHRKGGCRLDRCGRRESCTDGNIRFNGQIGSAKAMPVFLEDSGRALDVIQPISARNRMWCVEIEGITFMVIQRMDVH